MRRFRDPIPADSSHGLEGQIGSSSSLTDGFEIGVAPSPPYATAHFFADEQSCTDPETGVEYLYGTAEDAHYSERVGLGLGTDYIYQDATSEDAGPDWSPAVYLIRLPLRSGKRC